MYTCCFITMTILETWGQTERGSVTRSCSAHQRGQWLEVQGDMVTSPLTWLHDILVPLTGSTAVFHWCGEEWMRKSTYRKKDFSWFQKLQSKIGLSRGRTLMMIAHGQRSHLAHRNLGAESKRLPKMCRWSPSVLSSTRVPFPSSTFGYDSSELSWV